MGIKYLKNKLIEITLKMKEINKEQIPEKHLNLGETPEDRANAIRMKALQHCFSK